MAINRRQFLAMGAAIGGAGYRYWPDEGLWNPCLGREGQGSPFDLSDESLRQHELVEQALSGIDFNRFRDCHAHLIGVGDNSSGIWINPDLRSIWHPIQRVQFLFYLNASCADAEGRVDGTFVTRLHHLLQQFPQGAKAMLLAFDYHHDVNGDVVLQRSPFYTPNAYAQKITQQFPERFEWTASIHPYRKDAVAALNDAVANGARAVKWLPPAMGIDPSSPLCDPFYSALAQHDMPLLSHAGDEHAVDAGECQVLGNPLLLRRALDHGVRVIVAHCATIGSNVDLDRGQHGPQRDNLTLFSRLMDEPRYVGRLFGDISAITQVNRSQSALETIYRRDDWHQRLLYGSDYPLPGAMPVFSPDTMVDRGYISAQQAALLSQIRQHNALLFDFLLKRMITIQGKQLDPAVFESSRFFG